MDNIYKIGFGNGVIAIDTAEGRIVSLKYSGREMAEGKAPLFRCGFRDPSGEQVIIDATGRNGFAVTGSGEKMLSAEYAFGKSLTVTVKAETDGERLYWSGAIRNTGDLTAEWMELPTVSLKPLKGEGGSASVLFPYNEGAIVDSTAQREKTGFMSWPIEYPSLGCYTVFPNMICSQFQAYLDGGAGLYMGAHDTERGFKAFEFYDSEDKLGVRMHIRIYCGTEEGADYVSGYPVVWELFGGGWEDAAEIYRKWFETHIPEGVVRSADNHRLPEWYRKCPVVISYPVRGIHDMDEMKPNALFPYTNALPLIDSISEAVNTNILVLLMHWEGTAPWAPPYVWPPYGGEENFKAFRDALHEKGNMLGVYCSGFGYTFKSNLVGDYDNSGRFEKDNVSASACAGPDGSVKRSRICPGQRDGFDICPASSGGRAILNEAYEPLFSSGIDYAQILDQNHGGGQYLCYSKKHGHPPVPGKWMTASMKRLLTSWNAGAGGMLLGCESAAAEPFIGNLQFSDNRFELNWYIGRPVPLFSYIYHEYLRNFMGNQVSSPFYQTENTLFLRIAYSFACGDIVTLVLTPDGRVMDHWGCRDFVNLPDREEILSFVRNLTDFARTDAGRFLFCGRMVKPLPADCPSHYYEKCNGSVEIPDVFTAAYESEEGRIQIFVNHTAKDVTVKAGDRELTVPARNASYVRI